MPDSDQPDPIENDGLPVEPGSACVALVPVVQVAPWSRIPGRELTRPDPTFLAHLIATAEQVPQTRELRRATPCDAQIAYNTNQHLVRRTAIRTRQVT